MNNNGSNKYWEGVGRRKSTTARVRIYKATDKGSKLVNDKPIDSYFSNLEIDYIEYPLHVVGMNNDFVYSVKVRGGGTTGWKDAIRLGLARALIKFNPDYKSILRKNGLVTRDPRVVERKKVGLKKARKAPRFSKR